MSLTQRLIKDLHDMNSGSLYNIIAMNKPKEYARMALVRDAKEHGVKPTARKYGTTPKTVRKWLRRYNGKIASLRDRSRAPLNSPNKISTELEREIVRIRKARGRCGAERMRREHNLPCSAKAIGRVLREHGLIRKRRRKHQTKRSLRAVKAAWRPFQQICVDTKDLSDIPEYWPAMAAGKAPSWEYTARCSSTGTTFLGFADQRSLTHSVIFIEYVLRHLKEAGVDTSEVTIQTDNGGEFIGHVTARDISAFTRVIEQDFGATHRTIPPGRHTWQADVETFHSTVETELFEVESFASMREFEAKANSYLLYYNLFRPNSGKEFKPPAQLLTEKGYNIINAIMTPVMLNNYLPLSKPLPIPPPGVYHVWNLPCLSNLNLPYFALFKFNCW